MPRRGENIYKRKDGRWEGRFVKQYDENNKPKYGSVYAHSYKEVKQKLKAAKMTPAPNSQYTAIKQYAIEWLDNIQFKVKQSTYIKYTNIVNNHIIPSLGNVDIHTLSTELVKKFVDEKLTTGNLLSQNGLSPKSVKDIISVLRQIMKYAEEKGAISDCNFDLIHIKNVSSVQEPITENAHIVLVRYLLNDIDNIKLGILICLYTGLRVGEICAIKFKDISLTESIIYVNKTMQRLQTLSKTSTKKTEIVISTPKSRCSCREIPLPFFIIERVKEIANEPNAYLLTGNPHKFIEPRTMENKFKSCLKECHLENYTFHQLRHRFATYCVELGFEIKSLSEILGHSSVNITLNRYVHSTLELKRTNMEKLQNSLTY